MKKYSIANDYTVTPGGRDVSDGPFSGEVFRDTVLYPLIQECLKNHEKILINLDGTFGYSTSFLEETFGGLVRKYNIPANELFKILDFISEDQPRNITKIKNYINEADAKRCKR